MWAIVILLYLIFAGIILALAFRKRRLRPVELTKKRYATVGAVACAGIFLCIGIWAILMIFVFPFTQKLLFGKDAIIFLSFMDMADFSFAILLIFDFIGMFLALIAFYFIILLQFDTSVWVFYRDLKAPSLLTPDFNVKTDFSDDNVQRVTRGLNFILKCCAVICLVFFLLGDLSLLSYGKFNDNEIVKTSYGSFSTATHTYEDIDKVEISISRSPNGKNPVLKYIIYFNDGKEMKIGDKYLTDIHTLLKVKNALFVYLPYTPQQYNELINRYTGAKKAAYEFVFSDNLN